MKVIVWRAIGPAWANPLGSGLLKFPRLAAMADLIGDRYELLGALSDADDIEIVRAIDRQHDRSVALRIRPLSRRERPRGAPSRRSHPARSAVPPRPADGA